MNDLIYKKIISKKEFSQLPREDVERAFSVFDQDKFSDEEKIKKTRDLLRKIFSGFGGKKVLVWKDKSAEEVLKKHLSTRERFDFYEEIYKRVLKDLGTQGCTPKNIQKNIFTRSKISVIDLGAGVNGFSYNYFEKVGKKVNYVAVDSVGQLMDSTQRYFDSNKISAQAVKMSLFELNKIKKLISATEKPQVVFMFKVVDALEKLERNYSKKLLKEIMGLVDTPFGHENLLRGRCVLSLPTESWNLRKRFFVQRTWLIDFIKENWNITDDFVIGGERYLVIENK